MEQLPLRDIHLPPAIGWWPPAPGWWMALGLLIAIAIAALVLNYFLKKRATSKMAVKLLVGIKKQHQQDSSQTLAALSELLRRAAMTTDSRDAVANLRGSAWLDYLDVGLKNAPFSNGPGRCLADAQYQPLPPADVDYEALFKLCELWLKRRKFNHSALRSKGRS